MFGTAKKKVVSVFQQGFILQKLGDIEECSQLVAACYDGFKDESNLTKARFSFWVNRKKKKLTVTQRPPNLEFLPPTTEIFQLHV